MLLMLLLGCERPSGVEMLEEQPAVAESPAPTFQTALGRPPHVSKAQSRGTLEMHEQRVALTRIINSTDLRSGWQAADAGVRAFLDEHSQSPHLWVLEQQAALDMLMGSPILRGSPTNEQRDAILYYTRLLNRNHFPHSGIIARSLDKLSGLISGEELTQIARSSLQHAETFLDSEEAAKAASKAAGPNRLLPKTVIEIETANATLRSIINENTSVEG